MCDNDGCEDRSYRPRTSGFLMASPARLVLASASPRRREMLTGLGWRFEAMSVDADESALPGEPPKEMALRLAEAKALAGSRAAEGAWTIGADTVVDLCGEAFGKPADRSGAKRMLRALSGKTHIVHTGVAIALDGVLLERAVESTSVKFAELTERRIEAFLATGEGDDKAGAYAIQGVGALLVERVEGCYSNVVGLPVFRLSRMLENLGWPVESQWKISRGGNDEY